MIRFGSPWRPWLPAAVLGTMMLVQFVFILVLLKRRDSV